MGIHKDSCMDASCQGCNVQTAPASPPPQMVMMAMPQSPPLSPTGSTVELLEHEVSKGDWKGADNVCCCCEKGGNKLTLTDKRVIVKYWENCMPGCAHLLRAQPFVCPRAPSTVGVYAGCVDVEANASDESGTVVVRPKGASWRRRANSSRMVMMMVADEWSAVRVQLLRVVHAGGEL